MKQESATIYELLSKVQGELKAVPKNGKNPHFKSDYATLDDIIQYTSPILSKHNLSVTHIIQDMCLITSLHFCNEKVSTSVPISSFIQNNKNALHQLGSAMTYIKRYNLAALLNIALGDDIDGGGSSDFNNTPIAELPWLNWPRGNKQNQYSAMIELFYEPILQQNLNENNIFNYFSQTHKISAEMREYLECNAIHEAAQYNAQLEAQLDNQTDLNNV
tara:strand:+ start:816 stop:1469 length:654 start_codon:yes stop_codon:yes gene_type:complete